MTILLADLVSRLTADVPAVSSVPSAGQYEQAVKDAVADLSRRASVVRVASLAIVAGTAAYAVPFDFQRLIRLAAIGVAYPLNSSVDAGLLASGAWERPYGGAFVTDAGLVPFTGAYREQVTVAGDTLTIYPTPATSATRQLVYAAGDALQGDAYPTLTEDRASVALLLARATCLDRISSSPGGRALRIVTGGDEVDFRQAALASRAQADGLRAEYLSAVASLNAGSGGLA